MLVSVTNDDLADHDARLGVESPNVSQAMAIKRRPLQRHFSSSSECFLATAALAATRLFLATRSMKVGYNGCVITESR